jgi:signal transduction histidine kinase
MLAQVLADADATLAHPMTVAIVSGAVLALLLWVARTLLMILSQLARLDERVISVCQKLVDHMAEEERQRADEVDRIGRIEHKVDMGLSIAEQRRDADHGRAEA